jgi:hypothetical protein
VVIYLKHAVHGTKVAICDAEVEEDAKYGWTVYTHDTPKVAAPVEEVIKRKRS